LIDSLSILDRNDKYLRGSTTSLVQASSENPVIPEADKNNESPNR